MCTHVHVEANDTVFMPSQFGCAVCGRTIISTDTNLHIVVCDLLIMLRVMGQIDSYAV